MPIVVDKRMHSRRTLLVGGIASLVAGCVESPAIFNALKTLKYSVAGFPDVPIRREAVSKIPYASISAKIGIGPRSILILWRREHDDLHWISADRAIIVTRHGRVVRTYGLPENLKDTQSLSKDPLNRTLHLSNGNVSFSRAVDIDIDKRYSIPIESVFEKIGPRQVTIAEIEIKTVLFAERNTARTINWSFTNYFWVDQFDGYVWKSRQHIARSFEPINIEILKPAV